MSSLTIHMTLGSSAPDAATATATGAALAATASDYVERPFAAPVTTQTFTVPSGITNDGTADASADLQAWINSTVEDGSIIDFAIPGAVYRLDLGLFLDGRHNLVFQGNGSTTLDLNGSVTNVYASGFVIWNGCSHIAINDLAITGPRQLPLTDGMHAVNVLGWSGGLPSSYVEMGYLDISNVPADGLYVEGQNTTSSPSSYVWVHDCNIGPIGKNAISCVNVTDVWFENNNLQHIGGACLDVEQNLAAEQVRRVIFRNNTIGAYGEDPVGYGWFVSDARVGSGVGAPTHDISVTGNTIVGGYDGYDGRTDCLTSRFLHTSGAHATNIVITGNSSEMEAVNQGYSNGGVLYCTYIDGLTVTGNTQPLDATPSILVRADNCTDTTLTPNYE